MRTSLLVAGVVVLIGALASTAGAQVAGSTTLGVSVSEMSVVAAGWSARKQILGRIVYNEHGERVGKVDDLIIAPDRSVSFAIIGAGGFVGMGRHDVAIPIDQIRERRGKLLLDGATQRAIMALPPFEYSKSSRDAATVSSE